MKREREIDQNFTIANCLMFLSQETKPEGFASYNPSTTGRRVFECKTCYKQFPSFQALGGHRASHKKPKVMDDGKVEMSQMNESPSKPKTHECSICGLEFGIGQALGGHMRRHRAVALNDHDKHVQEDPMAMISSLQPGAKKISISCERVRLDLNLTPLENDSQFLKLGEATVTHLVDCFF